MSLAEESTIGPYLGKLVHFHPMCITYRCSESRWVFVEHRKQMNIKNCLKHLIKQVNMLMLLCIPSKISQLEPEHDAVPNRKLLVF